MAATQFSSQVLPPEEVPTVRPPRPAQSLGEPDTDANGIRRVPLPASLWQLAREVMLAEADEAMWENGR
jgi:hypothetical protein